MKYEKETLHKGIAAIYENNKTLYEEKNGVQSLILFENPKLGRILMIDGVTQVTLFDEFVYHEMMTHVPILSHDDPKNILIIGGGDGGIAREALRHKNIDCITMVEIDKSVVDFSLKYLPEISDGAFDNPKLKLIIADGAKFISETSDKFDIIIVDSTDPIGPGEVLFTKYFYNNCHNILTKNGILVTQNGVPFMQPDELKQSLSYFKNIFKFGTCYRATIPTYVFGEMTMGFASNKDYSNLSVDDLKKKQDNIEMKYYTAEVHKAAFALPKYIQNIIYK